VLEDVRALLYENKDRLETMVAAGGAAFRFEADGKALAWIDGAAFLRALFAVVHNAAKFAGSRVEVRILGGAHHVDVVVLDDGPGFSEAGLVHATERFWREDRSRARSGNGLGLSIARSIVESCGGRLLIANRRHEGAMVTLRMKR
jgi:signal transduction histidine kinase